MQSKFFVGEHLLFIACIMTEMHSESTRLTELLQIYVETTSEHLFSVFRYDIFLGIVQIVCLQKTYSW